MSGYTLPELITARAASGSSAIQQFPAPWFDYASTQMPTTMMDALRWSEFIVATQPSYRAAIERVVSYFITELEIGGTDEASKRKYKDLLENKLGIHAHLKAFGLDFLTYGNSFVSVMEPVVKYFTCGAANCGFEAPALLLLEALDSKSRWVDGKVVAQCPSCKKTTTWKSTSRRQLDENNIYIKRWSPYEIEIEWCPVTDKLRYIWRIPSYFRRQVSRGDPFVISNVPDDLLAAALNNQDIRFFPDELFHAKEATLAGHHVRGWGVSRVLTHFRQAWLLAVFHRHNEAIALDYIMPLRIISPESRGSVVGDPLLMGDMGAWASMLDSMVTGRRHDPTRWAIFPFPVRYQFVGAEGSRMAPVNLIEQTKTDLLDSVGIPIELYRANLSVTSAPVAVRLFETCWSHLVFMMNRFLQWITDKIARMYGWDKVTVKLMRPSISDDINRQMARLQLMLGGVISRTTALRPLGIDIYEETARRMEEEKMLAEQTAATQRSMEQVSTMEQLMSMPVGTTDVQGGAMGGGMPGPGGMPMPGGSAAGPGGMPMPGGPPAGAPPTPGQPSPYAAASAGLSAAGSHITPMDVDATATTIAQQLYALPLGRRISELRKLRTQNPVVHALVKEKLRQFDTQGEQQGREAARGAAMQGAGPAPRPM